MNEELKQSIQKIKTYTPENLKREGKDYEFTDIYSCLKELYAFIDELQKNEDFLETLPETKRNNLTSGVNSLATIIEQIANFSPSSDNPQGSRDSLSAQIKGAYETLYDQLVQPLRIFLAEKRSARTQTTKVTKRIENLLQEAQKSKKEIDQLLQTAKKTTAQVGFVEYSKVFENQAKEHKGQSWKWLKISVGLFVATIVYFLYIFFQTVSLLSSRSDSFFILALFLAKLFPATVIYYALYQSIKNYNANMHLYTLNKHRENVLRTFESFVKSTDDPKIKDALLKEAAKAIFITGDTGYLSRKAGEKEGWDLIQIINDLTKKEI